MIGGAKSQAANAEGAAQDSTIRAPVLSLPKGGGAIRGIGEKFGANPVTGTGSMSVPIATSPGRSGFGPQLALTYDSGAGNGPFGFGWSLSLPAITRKTDKGLPRYDDPNESDVFILSGAEDLVPRLVKNAQSQWVREVVSDRPVNNQAYRIQRYRPRIEGLFACIERWTNQTNPADCFWRSISKDNITTWYGKTENSRIFDPADKGRIFSWLICQSYDDKRNAVLYEYKCEDSSRILEDQQGQLVARAHERNRTDISNDADKSNRTANRYLKRIYYGNREPYLPKIEEDKPWPVPPSPGLSGGEPNWFFEVVFDYDDGHYPNETTDSEGRVFARPVYSPPTSAKWSARVDPFSSYRAGFEVRTYRLCQRVLMFHHFEDELATSDCLVRSTDFTFSYENNPHDARNPIYSFLNSASQSGYVRQTNDTYLKKSLPPLQFEYTKPEVQADVREVDPRSLENLPYGLDGAKYQWVDLDGEGISGILTEQGEGWFYKRNLSPVNIVRENGGEHAEADFAPLELVTRKPSLAGLTSGGQFLDLAGDGQLDFVELSGPTPGFFERTHDESWEPFKQFASLPNIEWSDPNLRFVDLTGDGHADVLITEDEALSWYPSLAEDGFGLSKRVLQGRDEEKGPHLVFADANHSIYLADLSGDGLSDLVRIRNGEVCYWPNLGYGRFGSKVTMDKAPWFDNPDQFDPRRIQLADIDGTGTTDIIYLGREGVDIYFNQSGNSWSNLHRLDAYPQTDNLSSVTAMDLLGTGTACLVWSSPLPGNASRPMRYLDLMGSRKPHLLVKTTNNLGAETEVQYAPSTKFYVADKLAGKPWITKIPFPVHVVEKVTVTDEWRKTKFSTAYSYHHGYFDGIEREFRGFGRVEQVDVENYGEFSAGNVDSPFITQDRTLYQPPVKTVTWFHTGACIDREHVISQLEKEYFPNWLSKAGHSIHPDYTFSERALPEPDLITQGLSTDEWREALRSCRGVTLRQETYELDVDALTGEHPAEVSVRLFSAGVHNCQIQCLQPHGANRHAVFLVTESEALNYHYELDMRPAVLSPDPRITHMLNLAVNKYGQPLQTVAVAYPRVRPFQNADPAPTFPTGLEGLVRNVQNELHLAYTETRYTDDFGDRIEDREKAEDNYRLRLPCEVMTYELTGIRPDDAGDRATTDPWDDIYFTLDELRVYLLSERLQNTGVAVNFLQYHLQPTSGACEKRIVEHVRMLFFKDDSDDPRALKEPLPFGRMSRLGLAHESYKLALTKDLLNRVLVDPDRLTSAYTALDAQAHGHPISGYYKGDTLFQNEPVTYTPPSEQYWMGSGIAGFEPDAKDHFYLPTEYTDPFGNKTTLAYNANNYLFIQSSADPLGNMMTVTEFDYRILAPREVTDPNDNYAAVAFDTLGMPVASAVMGKNRTESGDNLTNLQADLTVNEVDSFLASAYAPDAPLRWLKNATARFVCDLGEKLVNGKITYGHRPAGACAIMREKHVNQLQGGENRIQVAVEYSDGMGTVLLKKAQAEPAEGSTALRWIASGKTILNNKGKPVKQYEPYFSDTEHRFDPTEAVREVGVTPIMYYDAVGRLIRTELPDDSFSRVEFSPWHVRTFDQNDTVTESRWYTDLNPPDPDQPLPRDPITNGLLVTPDQRAAWLAAQHRNTPALTLLDSLGRDVVAVTHNRYRDASNTVVNQRYVTFTKLDGEGKPLWIRDARGNLVMQYVTLTKPTRAADEPDQTKIEAMPPTSVPCYDIAGNLLFQHSMDAGDRWMITDAAGKPLLAWDYNERKDDLGNTVGEQRRFRTSYDALHRPVELELRVNSAAPAVVEAFDYVDTASFTDAAGHTDAVALDRARKRNLIGQAMRHWDPSGLGTIERVDFAGRLQEVTRSLVQDVAAAVVGWSVPDRGALLEPETFIQITEYDALGRMTTLYNWHRDVDGSPGQSTRVAVYVPQYNERVLLKTETLHIRASKQTDASGRVSFTEDPGRSKQVIRDITYNEKGQRLALELGNGTTTRYRYDPETFRLVHLYTRRDASFTNDCASGTADAARPLRPCGVQNLHYTYDPVGNIMHIQDDAQQTIWFNNQQVEPSNDYTYDALYRLIEATGRENAAAVGAPPHPEGPWPLGPIPSADETRNYTQRYRYDSVGNFQQMQHFAPGFPGQPAASWTRHYTVQPDSNRLDQTWYGNDTAEAVTYHHDPHGSMLNLERTAPGLDMRWDWRDMIRALDLQGGGWAYYSYGIDKQRTRKYISRNGGVVEDRIYLGGYELYRRYSGATLVEEIESHHLFDADQRVLLVDDVLISSPAGFPRPDGLTVKAQTLFRYEYGNHLGSACLELDHQAQIISCEEFHPYGTSAYRAMKSEIEAPAKRYRYTGMERDEESALSYHAARYYATWLAKWTSVDPYGAQASICSSEFCTNNPIRFHDRNGCQPTQEEKQAMDDLIVWQQRNKPAADRLSDLFDQHKAALSVNMCETLTPPEFTVEAGGESVRDHE